MGKRSMEERIQEETSFLIKELAKTNGKPIDLTSYFFKTVCNVICSVVYGSRFEYEDKRLMTITENINKNSHIMSSTWGTLFNMYPHLMSYIPGPHKKLCKNFDEITKITLESIKYHEETVDPNCPRDYIDCFLLKIKQENDHLNPTFYRESLLMSCHNLLFGGTDTVSSTLKSGILALMKYPEITEKMQEEIDRVVGRNRSPSIEDRVNMPYTDATIHEILRFSDVIPLSLPHCISRDTVFKGYVIPKGTYVTPLLTSVHNDPAYFAEPNKFNPNHFLDDKGGFKKNDAFIPFSAGKRVCPGQSLGRMELFIYFTSLLQNFNFNPVIDKEKLSLQRIKSGLGTVLMEYECRVIPR